MTNSTGPLATTRVQGTESIEHAARFMAREHPTAVLEWHRDRAIALGLTNARRIMERALVIREWIIFNDLRTAAARKD